MGTLRYFFLGGGKVPVKVLGIEPVSVKHVPHLEIVSVFIYCFGK